jgi:kumamolisin
MANRKIQFLGFSLIFFGILTRLTLVHAALPLHKLPGHVLPISVIAGAKPFLPEKNPIAIAVRLNMQHEDELTALLTSLYDPTDAMFGKYLTSDEFTSRFGATLLDFNRVEEYFIQMGCTVTTRHPNRLMIDFECSQAELERGLEIRISNWLSNNEVIRVIDTDPSVPEGLPVEAILGLTNQERHPHIVHQSPSAAPSPAPSPTPPGSGPLGGLSPSDVKSAYNLNGLSASGAGQVLGLFELDGYTPSDISTYATTFGLSKVPPLQNVLVDGFNGTPGMGADEVTLDIQLMMGIAPGAKQIIVYEGPNTDAGVVDVYQKIATDNVAKQVSTSWGIPEAQNAPATLQTENKIFMQMAAQGQSIYAASGDSGANDDGQKLGVDDPSSQPYITAAGGTTLSMNPDHSYLKETAWWDGMNGGGGGISTLWPIPSWQVDAASAASRGSNTHRNTPDISLNADQHTGYALYVGGQWETVGGTSCAAPIWAAFTALVNEKRAANGSAVLGFANPTLYQIGSSPNFHDVADGTTNGFYPTVTGFDLATGWGTLNGANLLATLSPAPSPSPSPVPRPSMRW